MGRLVHGVSAHVGAIDGEKLNAQTVKITVDFVDGGLPARRQSIRLPAVIR